MSGWRRLLNLLPGRRRAAEADVREELEALRELAEPGELGNLTLAAEDARAELSWPRLEQWARDLAMAFRTLRRSAGYTLACIVILGLGIGVNTAIFSVVHAVVLKPLPFPDADRLVFLWQKFPEMPDPIGPRMPTPRIVYEEWRRQDGIFSEVAAYKEAPVNEAGVTRPRTISTGFASANLFSLLGAGASIGRLFHADEEQPGHDRVVVLSDEYFARRFARDPAAIGGSITLGRDDYTVIGVLAGQFRLSGVYEGDSQRKPELWLPLSRLWNRPADHAAFQLFVMARRNLNVSLDQARVAVTALQARLHKADVERYPAPQASVFPVEVENQSNDLKLALYVLLGATGLLLLIGCANLANLTLARTARRAREISIRLALGASRRRIAAQLLTESLAISLTGAAAGLLLARATVEALQRFRTPLPRPEDIELNWIVFAFAAAAGLLTTLLFGLAPAISASKVSLNEVLKSRGGVGSTTPAVRRRFTLTAAGVGLAVILLCGSGLFIRSFVKLVQTGLGFRTEKLVVADIDLPEIRYPDAASRRRFYAALLLRARGIPGVAMADVSTTLPLKGIRIRSFEVAGRPKPPAHETPMADDARVTPGYFRLWGSQFWRGATSPMQTGRAIMRKAAMGRWWLTGRLWRNFSGARIPWASGWS